MTVLKCEICGGELFFYEGLYTCKSCGNKSEASVNIESFDVFLMYNEFDEQGRRSKSSIIAQDIYNKLSEKNVSVFYEKNYDSFHAFAKAVKEYIHYYNHERIQQKTKWMPPVKYREASMCA